MSEYVMYLNLSAISHNKVVNQVATETGRWCGGSLTQLCGWWRVESLFLFFKWFSFIALLSISIEKSI